MEKKLLTDTSKFLSYVLRHAPESIGIELDINGWVSIDLLREAAAASGRSLSKELLLEVVTSNDKKRFSLSVDGKLIRAAQGHTTASVSVSHEAKVPPAVLYHGTATRFLDSILAQGLIAGDRHHVHLSENQTTAVEVGSRYGKPVLLIIDAGQMHADGVIFHKSDNGAWLTGAVARNYIKVQCK